jgi:hypothetical protein
MLDLVSEENTLLGLLPEGTRQVFDQAKLANPREVPFTGLFWPMAEWDEVFSNISSDSRVTITLNAEQGPYTFSVNMPDRALTDAENWLIGYYLSRYIFNRAMLLAAKDIQISAPSAIFGIIQDSFSSAQFAGYNLNVIQAVNHAQSEILPQPAKIVLGLQSDRLTLKAFSSDGQLLLNVNDASNLIIDMSLTARRLTSDMPHGLAGAYLTRDAALSLAKQLLPGKLLFDELEESFIAAVEKAKGNIDQTVELFWVKLARFYNHYKSATIILPQTQVLNLTSQERQELSQKLTARLSTEFAKLAAFYQALTLSAHSQTIAAYQGHNPKDLTFILELGKADLNNLGKVLARLASYAQVPTLNLIPEESLSYEYLISRLKVNDPNAIAVFDLMRQALVCTKDTLANIFGTSDIELNTGDTAFESAMSPEAGAEIPSRILVSVKDWSAQSIATGLRESIVQAGIIHIEFLTESLERYIAELLNGFPGSNGWGGYWRQFVTTEPNYMALCVEYLFGEGVPVFYIDGKVDDEGERVSFECSFAEELVLEPEGCRYLNKSARKHIITIETEDTYSKIKIKVFNPDFITVLASVRDDYNQEIQYDRANNKIVVCGVVQDDIGTALRKYVQLPMSEHLARIEGEIVGQDYLALPYGNLYLNDYFVVYHNGKIYHRAGEPFESREGKYTSL